LNQPRFILHASDASGEQRDETIEAVRVKDREPMPQFVAGNESHLARDAEDAAGRDWVR
jgi:hypothetical protein